MREQLVKHSNSLQVAKAACYFSPKKILDLSEDNLNSDLKVLKFITPEVLSKLHQEYPRYCVLSKNFISSNSIEDWWIRHNDELSTWFQCYSKLILIQTSSAVAERNLSKFNEQFVGGNLCSLEDYIEAAMLLSNNK